MSAFGENEEVDPTSSGMVLGGLVANRILACWRGSTGERSGVRTFAFGENEDVDPTTSGVVQGGFVAGGFVANGSLVPSCVCW